MVLVDTHAHLHFRRCLNDLEEIVERFKSSGGRFLINVGINIEDSKEALKIARRFGFKASAGIHPHDSRDAPPNFTDELREILSREDVVAVGETGLDFYRDLSPREVQEEVFKAQIDLAREIGKPLIVHVREAYDEVYEILKDSDLPDPPGVIHSFSADETWAKRFVDLGFVLGIGGPITYPKNHHLREAVRFVGLENVVVETDCPYLPPQRFRGKRNEPVRVFHVLEEISRVLGEDLESVANAVFENALRTFSGGA